MHGINVIYYKAGYKYQLWADYQLQTVIKPAHTIHENFFLLDTTGLLVIKGGYAWDGASGPTIDSSSSMRGSLVHDALYQMISLGLLPITLRDEIDYLFYDIIREDGMMDFRAWAWYRAVRAFGHQPALRDKPLMMAPLAFSPTYRPMLGTG